MIDYYFCGRLLKADLDRAAEVIARFGGTAKADSGKYGAFRVVGYFPQGMLPHDKRCQITSALTNEGIFAL